MCSGACFGKWAGKWVFGGVTWEEKGKEEFETTEHFEKAIVLDR